jgi:hypothetical protein
VSVSPDAALQQLQRDRAGMAAQQGAMPPDNTADILQQKQAALAPVEQAMTAESAQMPKPPGQAQLPEAPNKSLVDPGEYSKFSALLVAMGLIAGAKSGNWMGASASLNGALKGYIEGNQQQADASWKKYQADYDKAVEQHNEQQKEYQDVLENKKLSINQKFQQWQIIAAKYDDQQKLAIARRKSYDDMAKAIYGMDEHIAALSEHKASIDLQVKKSQPGPGNLSKDAIDLAAQRLANGEKAQDVLANFGRGAQGGKDIAAVQNRFAELAKEQGMTADEIALRQQEMRGSARAELALGEREGKIAPRVQEAKTFAQIALKASADVPRGDWKQMNQIGQWIQDSDSGKELGKFQAANVSLINAYSAAVGGGTIHKHDQEVGAQLLSTANGPENYKAKVKQLIVETEAALKAPEEVKQQWRQTREDASSGKKAPAAGGAHPPDIQKLLDKYAGP